MKHVILALALLIDCCSARAKIVQYLYIEANEGTASGGHVALQIDDDVFHYQYHDGLIRLNRDNSDDFRFDYRYLQNRPLHVADIEISDQNLAALQEHFKRQYWDQSRQFKRFETVEQDRQLLTWLLKLKTSAPATAEQHDLQLPGAGLFYNSRDTNLQTPDINRCNTQLAADKIFIDIQSRIQQRYGAEFLTLRKVALQQAIRNLTVSSDRKNYSFSERFLDSVNALLAIQAIEESRALSNKACHALAAQPWRLNARQTDTLRSYQKHLFDSAITLLDSYRPDWGQALFVTLARIIVLQQSIDSGQWFFLDDFEADADVISTAAYSNQAAVIEQQRELVAARWLQLWHELSGEPDFDDNRYNALELQSNRYHEWQSSVSTKTLRQHGQQPLPLQPLKLPVTEIPNLNIQALQQGLIATQTAQSALATALQNQYGYDLITRNCVTELTHSIDLAIGNDKGVNSLSGPGSGFIPFLAFADLPDHYSVRQIQALASFRQLQIAEFYAKEFPPWVFLRESNVLSAELYHYNPDDAAFVFFTDDAFFVRPLFGAFNATAALGQSMLGLLAWPFDAGERLRNGTRGFLMSLPELAFINIRKGSYKFAAPM